MEIVIRIVGIIVPVLFVSAIGYFYGRLRRPDMTWVNRLSTDLLFPMLIFSSMASRDFHVLEYLPAVGVSLLMMLGSGLMAWGVARLLSYNPHAFIPSMAFTNVANMGLPLTLLAFGEEMLPAAIAIFMVFSLLHFTIGIRLQAPQASIRGILKGPMLWAMIIGLLMSLMGWSLPTWLATCTKMLGDTAIPLGLFALGVGFSSFRINNWNMGIIGAILCPLSSLLVTWPFVQLVPMAPKMQGLLLLYAALPPAVMTYILAEQYQQDPGLVSAIVVCGTLASVIFVPFALYLAL